MMLRHRASSPCRPIPIQAHGRSQSRATNPARTNPAPINCAPTRKFAKRPTRTWFATRYDKLAVRYEAAVQIAAINDWLIRLRNTT
ncbi:hypothetical protein [Herbidospora cretacea]|uniref:hypothetical protein n=1 Tax=Herbidospora cretacea TaxID=28444 RepID=UPI0018CC74FB|nr:hypothetical protein [Herbidospora cretacea]